MKQRKKKTRKSTQSKKGGEKDLLPCSSLLHTAINKSGKRRKKGNTRNLSSQIENRGEKKNEKHDYYNTRQNTANKPPKKKRSLEP